MSRHPDPNTKPVYDAAEFFIERALRMDGSLFTRDRPVWSEQTLRELHDRFVEQHDSSEDDFLTKFERQLSGAPPEVLQLAAEVFYVHLIISADVGADRKRELIAAVLSWSSQEVELPDELDNALEVGLASTRPAFLMFRPQQLWFIVEFALQWKQLSPVEAEQQLEDPWAFKQFLLTLPIRSAFAQRNALLHLVHPDSFEKIVSRDHKAKIVSAFTDLVPDGVEDEDRAIFAITRALGVAEGEPFTFYSDEIRERWLPDEAVETETPADRAESQEPAGTAVEGVEPPPATRAPEPTAVPPTAEVVSRWLRRSEGLIYSPEAIALFLTALQTKGFVILSGVSGTGKTKLAQSVTRLMRSGDSQTDVFLAVRPDWRDSKPLLGYYNPLQGKYEATDVLRLLLAARGVEDVDPATALTAALEAQSSWAAEIEQLNERYRGMSADELTSDDLHLLWHAKRNGIADAGQAFKLETTDDTLREVTAILSDGRRSVGERIAAALDAFAESGQPWRPRLRTLRALAVYEPARIGTVVNTTLVRRLARRFGYDGPALGHLMEIRDASRIDEMYEFLSAGLAELVGPDASVGELAIAGWLLQQLEDDETVTAGAAPGDGLASPYVIILDEMNLARVEYYFADFLSVLESGRSGPDRLTDEAIRLHDRPGDTADPVLDAATGQRVPSRLRLPANLYVVGTINVDETTHVISPKVLDRAFTLEIADITFGPSAASGDGEAAEPDGAALVEAFTRKGRFAGVDREAVSAVESRHPEFVAWLQGLSDRLEPNDFHFAYRSYQEILMFVANAEEAPWFDGFGRSAQAAFDAACLCKVLPKISGVRGRVETPLLQVLAWALNPDDPNLDAAASALGEEAWNPATATLPAMARKATKMLRRVREVGFASYA